MDADEQISSAVAEIMAARPTFKVGDRVRVRLSGECQMIPDPASPDGRMGSVGHDDWEDGLSGRVSSVDIRGVGPGHTISLWWDRWMPHANGGMVSGGAYAPSELELLAGEAQDGS